jgi:putative DNA primase/helicase
MLSEMEAIWLCDIAYRMQCPLDFVGAAAFVMVSSVLGTKARMHVKQFDSWEVDPHLWGGVIGNPGSMKTPATAAVFKLLGWLDVKSNETYKQELKAYTAIAEEHAAELNAVTKALNKLRDARIEGKGDNQKEETLKARRGELLQNAPHSPALRHLIINDPTIEALQEILKDAPDLLPNSGPQSA